MQLVLLLAAQPRKPIPNPMISGANGNGNDDAKILVNSFRKAVGGREGAKRLLLVAPAFVMKVCHAVCYLSICEPVLHKTEPYPIWQGAHTMGHLGLQPFAIQHGTVGGQWGLPSIIPQPTPISVRLCPRDAHAATCSGHSRCTALAADACADGHCRLQRAHCRGVLGVKWAVGSACTARVLSPAHFTSASHPLGWGWTRRRGVLNRGRLKGGPGRSRLMGALRWTESPRPL
uniref:Uncharacterized protein n=1 Tax=Eutreptiella gymnastica TaxID=73025 RepID=A0A7S4FKV3_9EUGL|mmetsp:Transcript_83691/g.139684  ORF Transcript_83691/g.139684 Transcript_83691/m.139684 type:complete len:232 (+) Transcript_83691:89-784(+)